MTTNDENKTNPNQFTLRALMIFVTALAVLFACVGYTLRRCLRNYEVSIQIRELGGVVNFHRPIPFGTKKLAFVERVILSHTKATDETLEKLVEMTEMTKLHLCEVPITDKGLKHIAKLPNLQYLDLMYTNITTDGLNELKKSLPARCMVRVHVLDE